jgi:hypothetical protein
MATVANFNIDQGSTFSTTINVESTASGVFQLNSYSSRGKIRKSYKSSSYVSFACSISENSPAQDTITISLTSAQTKAMKPGRYVYDVEIFTSAGDVIRLIEGQVEVLASASQANPLGEGIEFKYTEENFVPHSMFEPFSGTEITVATYADHVTYMNQGYSHVYPIGGGYTSTGAQSATDTISSGESASATDTTSNSPTDSGGESSNYY